MKNLEQIRAAHALQQIRAANALPVGQGLTQSDVNGLPALIVNNGLLATAAFATVTNDRNQPKRPGMKMALDAVAGHLAGRGLLTAGNASADGLIDELSSNPDAFPLQRATVEALAYLGYMKRFAKPDQET
jgi:CRISPR/Cas system CMR-associated protein Cmr5 small subunit